MILSRRELPAWAQPLRDLPERVCVYWQGDTIEEWAFGTDNRGHVAFLGLWLHTPEGVRTPDRVLYYMPPEVLIAAGVEAMRRRG